MPTIGPIPKSFPKLGKGNKASQGMMAKPFSKSGVYFLEADSAICLSATSLSNLHGFVCRFATLCLTCLFAWRLPAFLSVCLSLCLSFSVSCFSVRVHVVTSLLTYLTTNRFK